MKAEKALFVALFKKLSETAVHKMNESGDRMAREFVVAIKPQKCNGGQFYASPIVKIDKRIESMVAFIEIGETVSEIKGKIQDLGSRRGEVYILEDRDELQRLQKGIERDYESLTDNNIEDDFDVDSNGKYSAMDILANMISNDYSDLMDEFEEFIDEYDEIEFIRENIKSSNFNKVGRNIYFDDGLVFTVRLRNKGLEIDIKLDQALIRAVKMDAAFDE